jgi:hypothetical protein
MGTINGQMTARRSDGASCHRSTGGTAGWFSRPRVLTIAAAVVVAASMAAVASGRHWLVLADLLPLLYVLPCAAMMFVCMRGMNRARQTDTTQISESGEPRADAETRP